MPPIDANVPLWGSRNKRLPAATSYGEHAHDTVSLTLTVSGTYEEEFEEGRHVCRPLALQLKPRAVPHTTRTKDGANLFIVHVPRDIFARCSPRIRSRPHLWEPGVTSAFALACASKVPAQDARDARGSRRARMLLELLGKLERDTVRPADGTHTWVAAAEQRLRAELAAPPRLGQLARDAGVHPVHFARVFRRTFGRSVGEWIRNSRANVAVRALALTGEDVASIALRLGYYDQSHFGADFRRETGWSPARFRSAASSPRLVP